MSSKSEFDIAKVDFSNAISISPGTSPVEEQPKLNPMLIQVLDLLISRPILSHGNVFEFAGNHV